MSGWILAALLVFWFIGAMLANHELRLRHHGYAYRRTEDGRINREEHDHADDIMEMQWWPSAFSWMIWLPYRLYRMKRPVWVPKLEELSENDCAVP